MALAGPHIQNSIPATLRKWRYKKLSRMIDDPENMKKVNEIQETSVFIKEKKILSED